jgi:hypothetical protein
VCTAVLEASCCQPEGKDEMGKRFAIAIGVAAAGVMALGAQTAAAAPDVVKYDTKLTLIFHKGDCRCLHPDRFIYRVQSAGRKCELGRPVVLFEVRPGADRKLGTARSEHRSGPRRGDAVIDAREPRGDVFYAKVRREVHDEFVCRAERSKTVTRPPEL